MQASDTLKQKYWNKVIRITAKNESAVKFSAHICYRLVCLQHRYMWGIVSDSVVQTCQKIKIEDGGAKGQKVKWPWWEKPL